MKIFAAVAFLLGIMVAQILSGSLFAAPARTYEYMVLPSKGSIETLQNSLETHSAKGWRLHTAGGGVLIFEK